MTDGDGMVDLTQNIEQSRLVDASIVGNKELLELGIEKNERNNLLEGNRH